MPSELDLAPICTGSRLLAQLTQEEAEALELERGLIVYVRPSRETVFSS